MITGMPPMAYLPGMLCELAAYGLAAGVLRRFVRTGKRPLDLYIQLVSAMLIGRLVYGVMNALIFSAENYSFAVFVSGAFVTALPGIVIQLVLLPAVVLCWKRRGWWKNRTKSVRLLLNRCGRHILCRPFYFTAERAASLPSVFMV
ncbi:MAG: hypothetical protein V8T36_03625 [Ruthenibacterium lactatiformans]